MEWMEHTRVGLGLGLTPGGKDPSLPDLFVNWTDRMIAASTMRNVTATQNHRRLRERGSSLICALGIPAIRRSWRSRSSRSKSTNVACKTGAESFRSTATVMDSAPSHDSAASEEERERKLGTATAPGRTTDSDDTNCDPIPTSIPGFAVSVSSSVAWGESKGAFGDDGIELASSSIDSCFSCCRVSAAASCSLVRAKRLNEGGGVFFMVQDSDVVRPCVCIEKIIIMDRTSTSLAVVRFNNVRLAFRCCSNGQTFAERIQIERHTWYQPYKWHFSILLSEQPITIYQHTYQHHIP